MLAVAFFGLFFFAAFSSSIAGLKVMVSTVAEEFRRSDAVAVWIVTAVMFVLGTASALSFTPMEWRIAGEPVLDVIDRVVGGQVILVSGVFGAALFCWFIPPDGVHAALGTLSRRWVRHIYIVGRYLPVVVILWLVATVFL